MDSVQDRIIRILDKQTTATESLVDSMKKLVIRVEALEVEVELLRGKERT